MGQWESHNSQNRIPVGNAGNYKPWLAWIWMGLLLLIICSGCRMDANKPIQLLLRRQNQYSPLKMATFYIKKKPMIKQLFSADHWGLVWSLVFFNGQLIWIALNRFKWSKMWHFLLKCPVRRKYLVVAYQTNRRFPLESSCLPTQTIWWRSDSCRYIGQ